jgi:hypothetical protein
MCGIQNRGCIREHKYRENHWSQMDDLQNLVYNHIWQVLGVVIALIGIILHVLFIRRKALTCVLMSAFPFVQGSSSRVQLNAMFNRKTLESPFFFAFRFTNTGNVPLKQDDFVAPICLVFHKTNVILAEVFKQNPNDIDVQPHISKDTVEIIPVLLNPQDSFCIKVLLDYAPIRYDLKARIVGIKEIGQSPVSPKRAIALAFVRGILVSAIATTILSLWLNVLSINSMLGLSGLIMFLCISCAYIKIYRTLQTMTGRNGVSFQFSKSVGINRSSTEVGKSRK